VSGHRAGPPPTPGRFFHDGSPLTPEAVDFNLDSDVELFPGFQRSAPRSGPIIDQVNLIDDVTVSVSLLFPANSVDLFTILSDRDGMVASLAAQGAGTGEPVGTGLFKFVQLLPDQLLEMESVSNYRSPKPKVDTIKFHEIPEESARLAALLAEVLLAIVGTSPSLFQAVTTMPAFQEFTICGTESSFQVVSDQVQGFNCSPDGELRFEGVSGVNTIDVGVPRLK